MKKILNIVLCIVVILSSFLVNDIKAAEISTDQGKRFIEYWQTDYPKLLLTSSNYEYLQFINDFNGNALSLYLLNMADLFADTGVKPDRNKYIDVLMNIVFTYDGENSGDIAEQMKTDNLKKYEDYSEDVTDIGIQAVDKLTKLGGAAGELKDQISMAVDGLKVLKDNTENYCESLSRIETIISNYVKYDDFFEIIESNSKGELKEAASSIKRAMETSMNKYLYSYQDVSDENFNNWTEYIFNDVFIDTCKKLPEYENDETFKWYIDGADKFMEKFSELSGSWDLGASIGTLVGNMVVGGENLANRLLEIMAIKDIGEVLTGALGDIYADDFTKAIGTEKEIEVVERYVMVSKMLIGARIRGEYCWYSIIAHDAGLLSLFNKENGKKAEEVYKSSVNVLKEIQEELNEVIEKDEIDNSHNFLEKKIIGTWYTESYDTTKYWTSSYATTFKMEGNIVVLQGWRNKDIGTYEVVDKKTVIATYTENYIDSPGYGYQIQTNYKYRVKYLYNYENDVLEAFYDNNFKTSSLSNADDGPLYRK